MQDLHPYSPEERRKRLAHAARAAMEERLERIKPGTYPFTVAKRVLLGVYEDGFLHAGNLAYLALVTLFPFFIVAAALARLFGRTEDGIATVNAFLLTIPPNVAAVLESPINDVLAARSGSLLWLGAAVGLWTTTSFIETIRDILRRAYGVRFSRPFWEYRLGSIGIIVLSVIMAFAAFSFQVALVGIEKFVASYLPLDVDAAWYVATSRMLPAASLFIALYVLFVSLTPKGYRGPGCPKWPGALFVTLWWLGVTEALPWALTHVTSYDLTYGSLAGVMIVLIFFYLVGFGVVIGAELNAALAESPDMRSTPAPAEDRKATEET